MARSAKKRRPLWWRIGRVVAAVAVLRNLLRRIAAGRAGRLLERHTSVSRTTTKSNRQHRQRMTPKSAAGSTVSSRPTWATRAVGMERVAPCLARSRDGRPRQGSQHGTAMDLHVRLLARDGAQGPGNGPVRSTQGVAATRRVCHCRAPEEAEHSHAGPGRRWQRRRASQWAGRREKGNRPRATMQDLADFAGRLAERYALGAHSPGSRVGPIPTV